MYWLIICCTVCTIVIFIIWAVRKCRSLWLKNYPIHLWLSNFVSESRYSTLISKERPLEELAPVYFKHYAVTSPNTSTQFLDQLLNYTLISVMEHVFLFFT